MAVERGEPRRRGPVRGRLRRRGGMLRSGVAGKELVTRGGGLKVGRVADLWVDIEAWDVVAVDVRGADASAEFDETPMDVDRIVRVGDVVLVDDEGDTLFEPYMDLYGYTTLVGADVVSETGVPLGRVRDFVMGDEVGGGARAGGIPRRIHTLILDALGLDFVPEVLVSTYALDVDEVLSVGPQRLLVFEGAEARLEQLTAGPLLRLNLAEPPWAEAVAVARQRGGAGGGYNPQPRVRFVDPSRVMYGEEEEEYVVQREQQRQPTGRAQGRQGEPPRRAAAAPLPSLPSAPESVPVPKEVAGAKVAERYGVWDGAAELVRGDTLESKGGNGGIPFEDWVQPGSEVEEVGVPRGGPAQQQARPWAGPPPLPPRGLNDR